jgi:hypothetical protein
MVALHMAKKNTNDNQNLPNDLEIDRLFVSAHVLSLDGYRGITDESARVLAPEIGEEFKRSYSSLLASGLLG